MNRPRLLAMVAVLALGLTACDDISGGPVPPGPTTSQPASTQPASTQPASTQPASTQPAGTRAARTQVINYQPWAGAGRLASGISASSTHSGSCFSTSSATTAPGAYRCEVGNVLYDPCFADATSRAGEVACPSPDNPDSVAVIRLTARLPAPAAASPGSPVIPWLLVLANGQHCETITGTGGQLGGENEIYGCPGGGVYGHVDEKRATWTVSYAPSGAPASAMIQESVTKAYE